VRIEFQSDSNGRSPNSLQRTRIVPKDGNYCKHARERPRPLEQRLPSCLPFFEGTQLNTEISTELVPFFAMACRRIRIYSRIVAAFRRVAMFEYGQRTSEWIRLGERNLPPRWQEISSPPPRPPIPLLIRGRFAIYLAMSIHFGDTLNTIYGMRATRPLCL
jgi:hypothetical protein